MRNISSYKVLILGSLLLSAFGSCTPIRPEGKSPLSPARMSSDSIVLEFFFVRFPFGNEDANVTLWQEVDEQHLPSTVRRKLERNGFRVGLLSGQVPLVLSQMLELKDKQPSSEPGIIQHASCLKETPKVVRRHVQCRPGHRVEIATSGVYAELPVLYCEPDEISGKTFTKAQGMLAVKVTPELDGRVRLRLVPELHHGDPRNRIVGGQGAMRLDTDRPRRVYEDLSIEATLATGHMLVLSSLTERPGSLGHHFFTHENSGLKEQKLLLVRLTQTQHDDMFEVPAVLPLDELE